jgi:hypothetical protein
MVEYKCDKCGNRYETLTGSGYDSRGTCQAIMDGGVEIESALYRGHREYPGFHRKLADLCNSCWAELENWVYGAKGPSRE